ncbi:MAG: BatB protein [Desulfuromonas sp.]|nr:MAG: BatB protein [Desulfuromonas sp.]
MLTFAWPWSVSLVLLPLLLRVLLPVATPRDEAALWVPTLHPFASLADNAARGKRVSRLRRLMLMLGWLLLLLAALRPQWLGEPMDLPESGRDLLLAVDLSGSMRTEDFRLGGRSVDRLTALKGVADDFIARRGGDRLGLILFGDQAYVQAPLTHDHRTVRRFLDEAALGLAGDRTAIGDAIGLAVKRFAPAPERERVLVLLTDGANTAGEVAPAKAAELAAGAGMTIYTIGIGADTMELDGFLFSRTVNPSADLDEKGLTEIAEATGGRYFRARDSEGLVQIYALIDQLEPVEGASRTYRPVSELYPWPLAGALLFLTLLLLEPFWRRRGT